MKILQVINSLHHGGAETLVRLMHECFLEQGIDSHVIALQGDIVEGQNIEFLHAKSVYSTSALYRLAQELRQDKWRDVDVVHVHLFPSQLYVSLFRRLLPSRTRFVTTEHSTHNRRRGNVALQLVDKHMYQQYEEITCISEGSRAALADWQPSIKNRLHTIYNGVEIEKYSVSRMTSNHLIQIISVGRLAEPKNYSGTIAAMAMLGNLALRYQIVGEGSLRTDLEKQITKLHLEDTIQLLGHRTDVPQLLSNADIFVLYSAWEGFGLAVVEAMASGLPVIVSDVPGVNEIIRSEDDGGLVVPTENPKALADAIRRLIANPSLRNELGQRARERAKDFQLDAMIERYVSLYKKICTRL